MPKRIINMEDLHATSMKSMINALAKLIGDEVYITPVIQIDSSEAVLKAVDAVIEGLNKKGKKKPDNSAS